MIACMQSRNLEDKHILLTRSVEYLPALDDAVRARGALPVHLPCLEIEVIFDALQQSVSSLSWYGDIVFTSSNAVQVLKAEVDRQGLCLATELHGRRIAAVGQKTADVLRNYGVHVDIVPYTASQDGLIAAYGVHGLPHKLLFFRAEDGRDSLRYALEGKGVELTMVHTYRTVCPKADASNVVRRVQNNEIDAVLLGSLKTAQFYIQRIGSLELADQPVIVVISESLAEKVRAIGLRVQVVAKQASFEAMLDALAEYFDASRPDDRSI